MFDRLTHLPVPVFAVALSVLCGLGASGQPIPFQDATKDFVLVYSLPEAGAPMRDELANYFRSPQCKAQFKAVIEAKDFSDAEGNPEILFVGTPETNSYLASELRGLGIELRDGSALIDGRSYSLDVYDFEALYRSRGKVIALIAGPSFGAITGNDTSPPEGGGYQLRNRGRLVVEEGSVGAEGASPRLEPKAERPELAFTSKALVSEVAKSLAGAWTIPAQPDDYSYIDRVASGKRILFVGESPHYVPANHKAEVGIALRCASSLGYRAVGMEYLYSLWPYFEAKGRGEADSSSPAEYSSRASDFAAKNLPPEFDAIADFNASRSAGDRLLFTALDVDHAINHTKPLAQAYIGYLASKSSSEKARSEIDEARSGLSRFRSLPEVEAYLDRVGSAFAANRSAFSDADWEEIQFSLALERASIRYQLADQSQSGSVGVEEIRGEYFRKTIERAYAKAQAAGGGLVCVVGGAHATLNAFASDDPVTGRIAEARYFSREYGPTAGSVASIDVVKLGQGGAYYGDPLCEAAIAAMGDSPTIFLDLRAARLEEPYRSFSAFYSDEGPKKDGILFVR